MTQHPTRFPTQALPLLATLLALAPQVFGLNFSDTGGWRAPLSLDTTSVNRGDPTKVAWGIVPDGTRIAYPGTTYNNLNASFQSRFGLTYANMFTFIFNRIGAVSGLELVASPDDGALASEATPPIAGVRGQIRLVGSDLVAAFGGWGGGGWANGPGQGVASIIHLNTGLTWPSYNDWLDIAMHEAGHTIGFAHQRIYADSTTTTEYTSSSQHYGSITAFRNGDGPQFDDVYAMHRMYGDKWERNGGNDTLATAENLGNLTAGTRALGTEIAGLAIAADKTDFRSIDGTSDTDCFKFTITNRSELRVTLAPVGPTYDFEPEGGTRRTFQSSGQSDLQMVLSNASGVPIQTINAAGLGGAENLIRTLEAGSYSLSIAATQDLNQFYRLDLAAVTEPGGYAYWIAGYTTLTGTNAQPNADPDGDASNNLLEYAFGTDPAVATPDLQYTGTFAGGGTITLKGKPITRFESVTNGVDFRELFIRRKDYASLGLIYTPQFSATLGDWQNSTAIPDVLADDGTWQVCSVKYPFFVNGRKARFSRIAVTMP